MNEKKAVIRQTARRYREAKKREKSVILNEFVKTTGYHRKYAIHILETWGKEKMMRIEGRLVRIVAGEPRKRKPRRIFSRRTKLWGYLGRSGTCRE